MILNDNQLEILRKRPQKTALKLSIFEPQAVFRARINDSSISKGAREITYDTVSLGHFSSIKAGATMWVGLDGFNSHLGKIRVRSATSSVITVSENSEVEWTDDAYLTVYYYFELWPVFPRIISDPSNPENVIFYKDYDIPYSNQNSILGTFVNMGPHRAVDLDPASGQAQVYWSSTGTYNVLEHSLSYDWHFQGATVTGSSSANPGNRTYNAPGNYVTRLTVTDNTNGAQDTSYRYVRVHNNSDPPVQKWQLLSLSGSRDEGGYTASFKVFEDVPIEEHSVVVLYQDSFYGSSHRNLGGNYPNAEDIFWVGYVDKDSINYDYQHSEVTFSAHSITGMMKESSGFSVSVESVASPSKWYELLDMDGRRALYHYLRWHTTALNIADFQFVGDDYKIQFFDADRESMYDALDNYMRDTLWGKTVSDRQGKVWMETGPETYETPSSQFQAIMSITERDWMNEPSIEERLSDDLAFIEMGGIAYSGVITGTFSALLASAPGNAPGFHGSIETHEGLALLGQDQLNWLVGNVFASSNSQFESISMELAINASNLDIAPQETVGIFVGADETVRGIEVDGLFFPNGFSWTYSSQDQILLPQVDFKQLVNGDGGETTTVEVPTNVGPGFNVPGIQIPPIPPLTVPAYGIPSGTISAIVTSQIQGFLNSYASAGWHENVYYEIANNIRVVGHDRTPNEIDLDSFDPPGIYYISAQFTVQGTSLSAGFKSATFSITVNGGQQNTLIITGEADGSGNCTLSGHAHMLVELFSGSIMEITLGGGIGGFNDPYEFSVSIFRISTAA